MAKMNQSQIQSVATLSPVNEEAVSKFSLSFGAKKMARATSRTIATKRPRSMMEDEAQQQEESHDTVEDISTFETLSPGNPQLQAPYIIQAIPNRDWREESRRKRQKSSLPTAYANGKSSHDFDEKDVMNSQVPPYGLTVKGTTTVATTYAAGSPQHAHTPPLADATASKMKTLDEEALDALQDRDVLNTTIIIAPPSPPPTEDEVFRASYHSAPPMATLEEYAATPVEGFGAAILRGYLKDGETLEERVRRAEKLRRVNELKNVSGKDNARSLNGEQAIKRRPGLLGLGAKDAGVDGIELGAWGKLERRHGGTKSSYKDNELGYTPLALRNKRTGELITQAELAARLNAQTESESERHRSERYSHDDDLTTRVRSGRDIDRERRSDRDYRAGEDKKEVEKRTLQKGGYREDDEDVVRRRRREGYRERDRNRERGKSVRDEMHEERWRRR